MTALMPAWTRRTAVAVLGCCAIFVAVVGQVINRLPGTQRLDTVADLAVMRAVSQHQGIMRLVAGLGEKAAVSLLTVVVVLGCLALRRFNGALLAAIAMPVAPALTEFVLKPASPDGYGSFPSGHTTATFAAATVVCVLLATPGTRITRVWRLAMALGAQVAGVAVAVAVIGLGMHSLTDAVGGAAVGIGVTLSVALLLDLPLARRLLTLAASALAELPGSGGLKDEPEPLEAATASRPDAADR
jgi:membrane-associated phospholipid phosphatase